MKQQSISNMGHAGDPKSLKLIIDSKEFSWPEEYITGKEIKQLAGLSFDSPLYLAVPGPLDDQPISDEERVNLARPGTEHFYSKELVFAIIVNGRPRTWKHRKISYEQVVDLAFGKLEENANRVYTVTYTKGPEQNPQGSMVKGDKVFVTEKMIFNVTCTDKS